MKKFFILTICALFIGVMPAFAWGKLGHATIAKIAEDHLTPKAKKVIDKYLDGKSIIEYASYPDFYRDIHLIDLGFEPTNSPRITVWGHSFQANNDGTLYLSERRGNEYVKNCLLRIQPIIEDFKANHRNMTDSARVVSLAYIVHIVGDIHCPKHIRYEDEPSSGRYPINVMNEKKGISYHTYWDAIILNSYHSWGYSDLASLLDRHNNKERKEIAKGTLLDWAAENARESRYTVSRQKGHTISRAEANIDIKHAHRQIIRAGYRLAALLNEITK